MDKNEIRKQMKEQRRALTAEQIEKASLQICEKVCASEDYKNAKTVCLYLSAYREVDTAPLLARCKADGKIVLLPATDEHGNITLCIDKGTYKKGNFNITEPAREEVGDAKDVDLFVIPGLAFDKNGNRLGFGMGCYDRLLNGAKGYKIGICYVFQYVDALPSDAHDIKMDEVIYG